MGSVVSGWGTAAREEVSRAARKSITLGGGANGFLPDAWPGFSNVDVMLVLCSYGDDSSRIMENKFPVGTFGSFEWWNDCFTGKLPRKNGKIKTHFLPTHSMDPVCLGFRFSHTNRPSSSVPDRTRYGATRWMTLACVRCTYQYHSTQMFVGTVRGHVWCRVAATASFQREWKRSCELLRKDDFAAMAGSCVTRYMAADDALELIDVIFWEISRSLSANGISLQD